MHELSMQCFAPFDFCVLVGLSVNRGMSCDETQQCVGLSLLCEVLCNCSPHLGDWFDMIAHKLARRLKRGERLAALHSQCGMTEFEQPQIGLETLLDCMKAVGREKRLASKGAQRKLTVSLCWHEQENRLENARNQRCAQQCLRPPLRKMHVRDYRTQSREQCIHARQPAAEHLLLIKWRRLTSVP